jgi:HK97 family phage prohead protease
MNRCIPQVLEDGTAKDQDQAVAICSSMWEEAMKSIAICPQPPEKDGSASAKTNKDTKMNRAYAVLNVKQVDAERRIIEGMATTPTPDRVGDIIEPMGVNFNNPMPLLLHHHADQPVGTVKLNKPTKNGISFEARLPKIEEPGILKARVDEAWQSIKAGLIKGVSIGFRELESSILDDGGVRFIETEVLELSLVTIPANREATISLIKQFDHEQRAASGEPKSPPGVPGKRVTPPKPTPEKRTMKTVAEQISAFEAKRKSLEEKRDALMEKSAEAGETLDEADSEEYDRCVDEVKSLDQHISRLRDLEQSQAARASEVRGNDRKSGSESRGNGSSHRVSVREPDLPPGIPLARVIRCIMLSQGNREGALRIAQKIYPDNSQVIAALEGGVEHGVLNSEIIKANVGAASSTGTTWAGPLVGTNTSAFADFVEYLRPQTVIGKFGAGGIPSLRHVPFRVGLITQSTGGSAYWVGEGAAKPLTKIDFTRTSLTPLKIANIAVLTKEVMRDSNPSAEAIIRDQLAAAIIQQMDADFLDPDNSGTANIKPASISNGANTVVSSGTTADNVRTDIAALVDLWLAQNNKPSSGVWIMHGSTAMRLGLMVSSLSVPVFPGVDMRGGNFFGMPVIATEQMGYSQDSPGEGRVVLLVNASDIYLADEGGMEVDMSEEASLTMDDAPTGSSVTPTASGSPVVSMWSELGAGHLPALFYQFARS